MSLEKKSSFIILGVFLLLLGFTAYMSMMPLWTSPTAIEERSDITNERQPPKQPKSSASWELYNNITIDDSATGIGAHNWTWAVSQAWCSGSGTWADPYLLENITIYINNTATACINITNSNSYFKISNVNVRNNASDYGIGIGLVNVSHGLITDSTCDDNGDDGLYCVNCVNITLYLNTFNNNHHNGIYMDNCTTFTITRDEGNLNGLNGAILYNSTYNLFENGCEFSNNTDGITFIQSDLNNITDCIFYNNTQLGIEIYDSDECIITGNDIEDNIQIGIFIYDEGGDSQANKLYGNDFDTNTLNAEDNSTGTGNTWDNGVDSGNEWDDYPGADLDDDGIGDDPYNISGSALAQDRYPVWDDGDSIAPAITIVLPTGNSIHGVPPTFSLTIVEAVGISVRWYTLDSGTHNTTFTGTTGTIITTEWNRITGVPGQTISFVLTFYVNDTTGNLGSASVTLRKYFAPAVEHGEDEEDVYMYTLSQNQIYLMIAFAFSLSLILRFIVIRGRKS